MRTFHIAKTNGHCLTQEQYCFLDLTFSKLVASDVDMAATLDNVDIHLEGSDFRKITIDQPEKRIEELEEIGARLRDELHKCIENDRNSETIARIEKELTDVRKSLDALHSLGGNVYEEMLLGSYHYDHTIQKGVITLYVNNINKAAKSLPCRFVKQGLEYLTGYVFAHEAHHAYYDVNHSRISVNEIEEPMAEFGALTFLKNNALPNFDLALSEVEQKKYSPCWTSAYGFGEYIFSQGDKSLIGLYRNNNNDISIHRYLRKFTGGFSKGYPWNEEVTYYKWLMKMLDLKTYRQVTKSTTKRNTQKYIFNGISYSKRRLVLAVISDYASKHNIHTVKTHFDPVKNGNREVVKKYSTLSHRRPDDFKRYFVQKRELIIDKASPNDEYAVDNQWGIGPEFSRFLAKARSLGYNIY